MAGVSVTFFCGAIKILDKKYPNRAGGPLMEDFRKALEDAEMLYKAFPVFVPQPKAKKSRKP